MSTAAISPSPAPNTGYFNLAGAQQAGHDDDTILTDLARSHNYNVNAALAAGHSKQEILSFLSQNAPPSAQQPQSASPAAPAVSQPMSRPGPGAGSPSASGFGTPTSLAAPPIVDQGLFMPSEARRRANETFDTQQKNNQAIALAEATRRAQAGMTEDVEAFKRKQRQQVLDDLKTRGVTITPRMEAEIASGMSISPELRPTNVPGYVKGSVILASNPNATDAFGNPIDPSAFHRLRKDASGITEYFPEVGGTTKRLVTRPDGTTALETYDRSGAKVSEEAALNPALLPTTSTDTSTHLVTQQIENPVTHRLETVQVPTPSTSTTTRQRVLPAPPSGSASPAGLPKPPAATSASPSSPLASGLPPGSRVLGAPPSQQHMDVQQPLSPVAQSIVVKTQPQIDTLTRLQEALKPYKDSRLPMTTLLPRIAYSMGFSSDKAGVNQLLSNLEMTSITSAASALAGSTRARQFVEKAMLHTPNAWMDSGKLQYDKVAQIKQRLQDIVDVAKGPEGQKNPGLTQPPTIERPDPAGLRHLIPQR